ncbi:PA2779 family protein [Arsukibacterium sp.]|uniref:PA2779 family protein n=1 Tax=Arsukibacterium sp. TaxID=1977258 RepID=UPI00299E9640|nr:PA2779 family protein [Arsukibacterium sp.]MDX1678008.1 PA2779 family protein [Arsukibacterium sp.]
MNRLLKISLASAITLVGTVFFGSSQATAAVYGSDQVIADQQHQYTKQQVLAYVDTAEVQNKLIELGVSPADAKLRIASMTHDELEAFNNQLNEMPAGGIVGTIVTVLVVVAVLDLMGITDVYPFIRPVGGS